MTPKEHLERNLRTITRVISCIFAGVTLLFCLIYFYARRDQFQLIEDQMSHQSILIELQGTIGYGGMIHHFKNWILRPDEVRYRDDAVASIKSAFALLDRIESEIFQPEWNISLTAQRQTLESYLANIAAIGTLVAQGKSAREIDAAVRVNDVDALNELAGLRHLLIDKMRAQQAALVDRKNIVILLPCLFIVALLCGLVLLWRQRLQLQRDFDRVRLEEMEQFTQIAAHDLRAPLLHITSLADFALEDLQMENEQARALVQDYLKSILERVQKLDALIKAVFRYIQVEGASQEISNVNLRQMAEDLGDLHVPAAGRLQLEGDFPVIRAQQVELEIILRNLISNAVKHHPEKAPVIVLRHSVSGMRHCFEVEDNGPGIAPEHAEKIFGMFWSLHGEQKPEEVSGVGLALVKRIINRWGSDLSLGNAKPTGAVFRFTMPVV